MFGLREEVWVPGDNPHKHGACKLCLLKKALFIIYLILYRTGTVVQTQHKRCVTEFSAPPALALCNLPQATCSIHCLVLCGPQKDELTDDGDCKGAVGLISRAVRSKVCDGFLANGEKLWKTIDWLRLDHHLEEWETTKCEEEESQTAFKAGSWKLNKLEEIYFCAN